MNRVVLRQSDFSGGEIAPTFWGRSDLGKFGSSVRRAHNFLPLSHGPLMRRPGFRYCGAACYLGAGRLVGFKFSNDDQVVIELGDKYARFWVNGVAVSYSGSATAWSGLTTYGFGDWVSKGGLNYISNADSNTNHEPPNGNWWDQQSEYQIATPYDVDDLMSLKFTQSGDVLTITHPSYAPRTLTRTAAANWTLATITFGSTALTDTVVWSSGDATTAPLTTWKWGVTDLGSNSTTAQIGNIGETRLCSTPLSKSCNLVSGSSHAVVTWTGTAGHIYNVYRGINGLYGWVGQVAGASFTDLGQDPDYSWSPPQNTNPFSGAGNYPASVCYHDGRIIFAGTTNEPHTIWGSKVDDFTRFDVSFPARDDEAFEHSIASREYEAIRSLVGSRALLAFTSGGAWAVDGAGGAVLGPTSVKARKVTNCGASDVVPLGLGAHVLYEGVGGGVVYELAFSTEADSYLPRDLSVLARHLLQGHEFADWCAASRPYSTIWAVRDDGLLLSLTYSRELDSWAWAWHECAGGDVVSAAVVTESNEDILYVLLDDGTICRMASMLEDTPELQVYSDLASSSDGRWSVSAGAYRTGTLTALTGQAIGATATLSSSQAADVLVADQVVLFDPDGQNTTRAVVTGLSGGLNLRLLTSTTMTPGATTWNLSWGKATTTVTGLTQLNNRTVDVLADGASVGPLTVTGNQITLSTPAAVVHVGLHYDTEAETLDAAPRELRIRHKRVTRVGFELETSGGLQLGTDADHLHSWAVPSGSRRYTGVAEVPVTGAHDYAGRAWLEVSDPVPCTIVGVTREIDVGG